MATFTTLTSLAGYRLYPLGLLVLCLATFSQTLSAQAPTGSISGVVLEASTNTPLEYATIAVYAKADSALIAGSLADPKGAFLLDLPYGHYFAKVTFIGLAETRLDSILISTAAPHFRCHEVRLNYQGELLETVEVTGERELVQIALDRRIYNVGKDLSNTGGSAMDVLDNLPSVAVEPGGRLSLRGSAGVQILIDGKPSGLVSNGNISGLQSLSADVIERIEIITNPSVKFEAAGTAGIINIILKKEDKRGINGAASISAARPKARNAALSLNGGGEKTNLFSNVSLNDYQNRGIGNALQEAYGADGSTEIFRSRTIDAIGGPSLNLRLGSDINFDKNTTLTAALSYFIADEDHFIQTTYRDFLGNLDQPTGGSIRTETKDLLSERLEFNSTFKKTFGKTKQELVANIQANRNTEDASSDFLENYLLASGLPASTEDLHQRSASLRSEDRFLVKLDYSLPLQETTQLEIGWQSAVRNIQNDFSFEENQSGEWVVANDLTNVFIYEEAIHAAYAMYKNTGSALAYQFGLRTEYSVIATSLPQRSVNRYINLFPSAHLSYELPHNNTVQASYSRRIRRPWLFALNPYINLSDNRAFVSGNPALEPEWTDVYELGHVKKWDKGSLGTFLFYRHTANVIEGIQRETTIEGTPIFFRQPENLNSKDDLGLEFNVSYRPGKKWKISSDVFFYRALIDGTNISADIRSEAFTARGRLTAKVDLFRNWDLQLRATLRAPMNTPQGRRKSMNHLDAALAKDLLDDRGKLTLNVLDVFTSRKIRNYFSTPSLFRENDYLWNKTRVRLSFNYRFGQ